MAQELHSAIVAYNGIAIAGDDARYQVEQVGLRKDADRLTLTVRAIVMDTGSGIDAAIGALSDWRGTNGALTYQLGNDLVLDDLTGDGSTTVTSDTGGFTSADVGLWLSIRGAAPRRITAVGSSTSITVHSALGTGTYRAVLPGAIFAGSHAANTFTTSQGTWSVVQGAPENTAYARMVEFQVTGTIPPEGSCLKSLTVDVSYSPSRRRTVTIAGEYVACDYDDDGTVESARVVHDASISTLCTNHLSGYGGISSYELTGESVGYNASTEDAADYSGGAEPQKNYRFRRTYVELFVADHAAIVARKSSVTQQHGAAHGKGLVGEVGANVTWSCAVDHDSITESGLRSFYLTVVRPLIVAELKRHTGSSRPVIKSESQSYDEADNLISAQWSVFLLDKSSTNLTYDETTTTQPNKGISPTQLMDGIDHTYANFQIGATRQKTVTTVIRSTAPVSLDVTESATGASDFAAGVVSGSPGISISGGGGDGGTLTTKSVFGIPLKATGKKSGGEAAGTYLEVGPVSIVEESEIWGVNVDGTPAGCTTTPVYKYVITRNYVWQVKAASVTPEYAEAPKKGSFAAY